MAILDLPREVRQQIFHWVITSPATPPSCPSASQEGRYSPFHGIWNLPPQNPALPLLLASKQLHDEAADVVRRAPANYHVDIMFVKRHGLWTTWSLPAMPPSHRIDTVTATMRIFEPTDDLDAKFSGCLNFRSGDGGPEPAAWCFYWLFINLLKMGPGYGGDEIRGPYTVKRVELNVLSPTDGYAHRSLICTNKETENPEKWMTRLRLFDDSGIWPVHERLAQYMSKHLDTILALDYDAGNYGLTVYENLAESISIMVDGVYFRQWDVDRKFQNHRINYWGQTPEEIVRRKERYRIWKAWVDVRRERMKQGLELDNARPMSHIF